MPNALTTHQLDLLKLTRTLGRVSALTLSPDDRRDFELCQSVGLIALTEAFDFVLTAYGERYMIAALIEGE